MGRRLLLAVILSFAILGCSRKAVVHKYYVLETTHAREGVGAPNSTPLVNAVCEIMPVRINPAFSGTRIAVRTDSHQLAYYARHEWASSPDEALVQLAETGLQGRHLFSRVSGRVVKAIPQYRIQIQVHHLEVIQNKQEETMSAHLGVEFALIEAITNRALVSHAADERVPLKENRLNPFAAAISQLFYGELQSFADQIEVYFQTEADKDSSR